MAKEELYVAYYDEESSVFSISSGPFAKQKDADEAAESMAKTDPGSVFMPVRLGTPLKYAEIKTFKVVPVDIVHVSSSVKNNENSSDSDVKNKRQCTPASEEVKYQSGENLDVAEVKCEPPAASLVTIKQPAIINTTLNDHVNDIANQIPCKVSAKENIVVEQKNDKNSGDESISESLTSNKEEVDDDFSKLLADDESDDEDISSIELF